MLNTTGTTGAKVEGAGVGSGGAAKLLSDATVIAAFTGAAYLIAQAYEMGYYAQRGLPLRMVQVGLSNVLLAACALFAYAALLLILVDTYTGIIGLAAPRRLAALAPVVTLGAVGAVVLTTFEASSGEWIVLLVALVLLAGCAQLARWWDAKPRASTPIIVLAGRHHVGRVPYFVVGGLMLLGGTFLLGRHQARTTEFFLVTTEASPRVVLAVNGDSAVLAPVDVEKQTAYARFSFAKMSEGGGREYELRKLGRIEVRPMPATRPAGTAVAGR